MIRSAAVLVTALLLAPGVAAAADVNVLYAGSLVNLMEHGVGPPFDKATGDTFRGFGGGSNGLANQIIRQTASRGRAAASTRHCLCPAILCPAAAFFGGSANPIWGGL